VDNFYSSEFSPKIANPGLAKRNQKLANFANAFNATCKTDNGLAVFRFICEYLLFQDSTIAYGQNGSPDYKKMAHNEALRSVWVELRKHLTPEVRNSVERSI
jgi:hypothetical protein